MLCRGRLRVGVEARLRMLEPYVARWPQALSMLAQASQWVQAGHNRCLPRKLQSTAFLSMPPPTLLPLYRSLPRHPAPSLSTLRLPTPSGTLRAT